MGFWSIFFLIYELVVYKVVGKTVEIRDASRTTYHYMYMLKLRKDMHDTTGSEHRDARFGVPRQSRQVSGVPNRI
jgi:hypothetical protein